MNKEQQIEEMADILCDAKEHDCKGGNDCLCVKQAEAIFNAGYRKCEPFSQPHENGGEWISVEDRLPEKEQVVLCCLGLVMNVYTYKGNNTWEDDYGYWQKDEPITHWMPLPSLPDKERNND